MLSRSTALLTRPIVTLSRRGVHLFRSALTHSRTTFIASRPSRRGFGLTFTLSRLAFAFRDRPVGVPDQLFGVRDWLFGSPDWPFGFPNQRFDFPAALSSFPTNLRHSRPAFRLSRPAFRLSRPAFRLSRLAFRHSRPTSHPSRPASLLSRPAFRLSRPAFGRPRSTFEVADRYSFFFRVARVVLCARWSFQVPRSLFLGPCPCHVRPQATSLDSASTCCASGVRNPPGSSRISKWAAGSRLLDDDPK